MSLNSIYHNLFLSDGGLYVRGTVTLIPTSQGRLHGDFLVSVYESFLSDSLSIVQDSPTWVKETEKEKRVRHKIRSSSSLDPCPLSLGSTPLSQFLNMEVRRFLPYTNYN